MRLVVLIASVALAAACSKNEAPKSDWIGSTTCRDCHEDFYQKWATSFHGLAMQPFTTNLAATFPPHTNDIVIGGSRYRAEVPFVIERTSAGEKRYKMLHALGGKNVYYFLAELDRGWLQTLPVAFDVRRNEWYDTAASALRHFSGVTNELLHWTERPFTFNTSCFNCHVSQLSKNYDPATDSYRTTWTEPGINCETCHGPAGEHVRVCVAARGKKPPADLKIISTTPMTPTQRNDLCAPCHAKMNTLTTTFMPGDRYFDHYGLVGVEHIDFYPDGRDLGENYTFTGWRMNPCAKSGKFDCTHCHTSSGRYRFEKNPNDSCRPCHDARVTDIAAHSRHKPGENAPTCNSCHLPMTEFGRMLRSDHSFLPPAPSASAIYKSPLACTICHTDRDAAWADKHVRSWHKRDYQAPVLERAALVDAARKRDWSRRTDMLAYIGRPDRDEIYATSLIRLLEACGHDSKWPALRQALKDPSPLVRSAAATALGQNLSSENAAALLPALGDDFRLVRISAAASLDTYPPTMFETEDAMRLRRATKEYEDSLRSQPDSHAAHYNLGNHFLNLGRPDDALAQFKTAMRLEPGFVPPLVNAALIYARQNRTAEAEAALRKANSLDASSPEINFNLGLLLGEKGDFKGAATHLRATLKGDPQFAPAAYNLAVIVSRTNLDEAIALCARAAAARPEEPRYAYTEAFYRRQQGDVAGAERVLQALLQRHPKHPDATQLLQDIQRHR
ncbi:MAG: tetratricopeptide repeat protein [Verrucomicrobia bacterium]|nr:tetratricopeptide repeat protein [Verrucomicrobiota bacterium]